MNTKTVEKTFGTQKVTEKKYIVGLDLGQANDYTALIFLERTQNIITDMVPDDTDGVFINTFKKKRTVEDANYFGRHIERFKLGTPYPVVVERVKKLVEQPEVGGRYMLVVDQTGVGRPVFEMLTGAGLTAMGVTITGGDSVTYKNRTEVRVAKRLLVSTLQAVKQTGRVTFGAKVQLVDILQQEMGTFGVKINDNANDLYAAREGAHDDLILSLALALWFGEKYGKTPEPARSWQG